MSLQDELKERQDRETIHRLREELRQAQSFPTPLADKAREHGYIFVVSSTLGTWTATVSRNGAAASHEHRSPVEAIEGAARIALHWTAGEMVEREEWHQVVS